MDRELHFVPEHSCYVARWTGRVGRTESVAHWQELVERPEFRPELSALHDFRDADIPAGKQDIREVGEIYRRDVEPRVGFGRVAILVGSTEAFALAEHLVQLLELVGARIHYDEADAKEWVGLPRDFALPYAPREV